MAGILAPTPGLLPQIEACICWDAVLTSRWMLEPQSRPMASETFQSWSAHRGVLVPFKGEQHRPDVKHDQNLEPCRQALTRSNQQHGNLAPVQTSSHVVL